MKKGAVTFPAKICDERSGPLRLSALHVAWFASMLCAMLSMKLVLRACARHSPDRQLLQPSNGSLTVFTLNFQNSYDQKLIEHNCAHISRTSHDFFIYTDDLSQPYCSVCTCVPFKMRGCACPNENHNGCRLCEKLHFVKDRVIEVQEFAFLDSDLVILHDEFLDRLYSRSRDFDFLASYGFGEPCRKRYFSPFNSGLFFMRRLKELDYSELVDIMRQERSNNDQNVISRFVQRRYRDWDTLSLKWHCRFLNGLVNGKVPATEIPLGDCYTLHGRGPSFWERMKLANKSLLHVSAGEVL